MSVSDQYWEDVLLPILRNSTSISEADLAIVRTVTEWAWLAARDRQTGAEAVFGAWLPIETAPKGRTAVLVYRADTKCTYGASWDDITNEWRHFGGSSYPVGGEITHWMPLPAPPTRHSDELD